MEIMYAKPMHKQDLQDLHLRAFGAANSGIIGIVKGKIRCAETLHQPEHWRE